MADALSAERFGFYSINHISMNVTGIWVREVFSYTDGVKACLEILEQWYMVLQFFCRYF
jgi:hypothetical protein